MRIPERDGRVCRGELPGLDHVVAVRVTHGVAVAVVIGDLHELPVHAAGDEALHAVDEAHVGHAGDCPRLVLRHALARPPLHRGNGLLDEKNGLGLPAGLAEHKRHVLPAQAGQVEKVMIGLKRVPLVHAARHGLPAVEHEDRARLHLPQKRVSSRLIHPGKLFHMHILPWSCRSTERPFSLV